MSKLLIRSGERKGQVIHLADGRVSAGRDPGNNIQIPDRRISRQHAVFVRDGGDWIIEDQGSVNGTFVNGGLVEKHRLRFGDEITMGSTSICFLAQDAPEGITSESKPAVPVSILSDDNALEGLTMEMSVLTDQIAPLETKGEQAGDDSVKRAFQRLITLYRVSHDLSRIIDPPRLFDRILELVMETIEADRGFIIVTDEETKEPLVQSVREREGPGDAGGINISRTIIDHVMDTGRAVMTSDASRDERFKDAESVILNNIRSTMCVPITGKDKILGIMQLDTKGRVAGFSKDDLELLTAICSQAAVAVENARLFDNLKKAHGELERRQQQLIEAEKLSALGKLAGGVAHEINNPMTSILGYAQLAGLELAKSPLTEEKISECAEYVKIVEDEAQRCAAIAQTLLHFGRKKSAETKPVDINKVIDMSLAIGRFHLKRVTIKIEKDLASGLPLITGDANQLQQVFLNFIINARDAMDKGGTLKITTGRADDKWIEVKFSDTGCGIPEDKLEEIFKPLYTSKEEGKGTGLGLSVSQEIIDNHKGTIDVESIVGTGTTFIVRLPVSG